MFLKYFLKQNFKLISFLFFIKVSITEIKKKRCFYNNYIKAQLLFHIIANLVSPTHFQLVCVTLVLQINQKLRIVHCKVFLEVFIDPTITPLAIRMNMNT
ncbi:hypothetical protein A0H76_701 [Hepatospora eriocheir]|uniref:Uncharacterized protein n=1 Tax=Hepatospora eriocheir TaxID=1081669 RepID=A0A1X0Q756_9MICR|nr:hypothetical protein A0H76_701 [Hepatospora eriocheir]